MTTTSNSTPLNGARPGQAAAAEAAKAVSAVKPAQEKPKQRKETKVENAKKGSRHLRGSIAEILASDRPAFEHDDIQLLKFHGVYQQDDRDARACLRAAGAEKQFSFMVRTRVPGGVLSSEQYLDMDRLADAVTFNRSLRVTTRQTLQFHGIGKGELKGFMQGLHGALMTSLAACGDIGRNVMASAAPIDDPGHRAVRELSRTLGDALLPESGAYAEIWLDGDKIEADHESTEAEIETLYGEQYLPRKFKVAIALPDDNSVDVFSQDVGLIAVVDSDQPVNGNGSRSSMTEAPIERLNLLAGGGFGMTHRKADTYARLATPLGSIRVDDAATVVRAIAAVFRDHGNRTDRKHARLKYLIEDWGVERFRAEVEREAGLTLGDWVEMPRPEFQDWLGAHSQGDGKIFYGLWVENGRVIDRERRRFKSALREIVKAFSPRVILTPNQNVLLADLDEEIVPRIEAILTAYGALGPGTESGTLTGARRFSMACPALPTCGLALAESERYLPALMDEIDGHLERLDLADEALTVRMTGCPNGCARPYSADLGFVGRKPDHYDVYLGGSLAGDRLAELFAAEVPTVELVGRLVPVLELWSEHRLADEDLGDFVQRTLASLGPRERRTILTGSKEEPIEERFLAFAARVAAAEATLSPNRIDEDPLGAEARLQVSPSNPPDGKEETMTMSENGSTPTAGRIPRLGDPAPDFEADTTQGHFRFSEWQGGSWVVLFSHPADFTPVCTTELAEFARRSSEFTSRDVKLIGVSIDSIHAHLAWVENIRERMEVDIEYPLIADLSQEVAALYGLLHPGSSDTATVRALFVIDPDRNVRAVIYYPLNVGRNVDEVIRLVDALQTAGRHGVALPVNWHPGENVVVPPPKTMEEVAARRDADHERIDFYLHKKALDGNRAQA